MQTCLTRLKTVSSGELYGHGGDILGCVKKHDLDHLGNYQLLKAVYVVNN